MQPIEVNDVASKLGILNSSSHFLYALLVNVLKDWVGGLFLYACTHLNINFRSFTFLFLLITMETGWLSRYRH